MWLMYILRYFDSIYTCYICGYGAEIVHTFNIHVLTHSVFIYMYMCGYGAEIVYTLMYTFWYTASLYTCTFVDMGQSIKLSTLMYTQSLPTNHSHPIYSSWRRMCVYTSSIFVDAKQKYWYQIPISRWSFLCI